MMVRDRQSVSRMVFANTYFPVLLLIAINLIIGALIVRNYGESFDEKNARQRAEISINAISAIGSSEELDFGPTNSKYYGPAFLMAGQILVQLFRNMLPNWTVVNAWHFAYFLSFQIGLFAFYFLSLRIMRKSAAFAATLLFSTQPLLWGHAFINPKDIPFMAFFLASVASGIFMVESVIASEKGRLEGKAQDEVSSENRFARWLRAAWRSGDQSSKRRLLTGLILLLTILLVIWPLGDRQVVPALIGQLYSAERNSLSGELFSQIAEFSESIPADAYIEKALIVFSWINQGAVLLLLLFIASTAKRVFPGIVRQIYLEIIAPLSRKVSLFIRCNSAYFAGIFLGFSTAIRVAGPFSGVLVAGYLLVKTGKRGIGHLAKYLLSASLVTYISWPFLWENPIGNVLESLEIMSSYPWEGQVLFDSVLYFANELPSSYVPSLMLIQFTEPAIFLSLLGMALAIFRIWKKSQLTYLLLLLFAWLLLPLALINPFRLNLYDNFRALLFLVPPIFVFSGITLDQLPNKFQRGWTVILIVGLILSPSIASIYKLHPYEYVYYNSFVGGLNGAGGRNELDYWQTSYKEGIEYLNQTAPTNSRVGVWGAVHVARKYARPDLSLQRLDGIEYGPCDFDYALLTTRNSKDRLFPQAPVLFTAGIDDTLFTVVKEISSCG